MFCYIKYCAISSHSLRQSITERKSVSPARNRITLQITNDGGGSIPRLSMARASSFDDSAESDHKLTTQLVKEKSHELINKIRLQRHFDSTLEIANLAHTSQVQAGGGEPNSDNIDNPVKSARSYREKEKSADIKQAMRGSRKSIYKSVTKALPHLPRKTHFTTVVPNTVFMINPDCFVQILIDYVYEQVNIDKAFINLDLCDAEGNLLKLFAYEKFDSGKYILQNRKTYYVVKYELNEDGSFMLIEPLLRQTNKEETDLFVKVNKNIKRKSNSGSQRKVSAKSTDF